MNYIREKNVQNLESFVISVPTQKICVRIGYRTSKDRISDSVIALIEEAIINAHDLLAPKAIYNILDYAETNRHPIFAHAEKVALCICTIGPRIERESARRMKDGELMKSLILDAIGSEAVEQVARQTYNLLCKKARELDLWPSKRFSPGYKFWDIKEQRYIFRAIPGGKIGVKLNESCMMIPIKSVSYRINFYKTKEMTARSFR